MPKPSSFRVTKDSPAGTEYEIEGGNGRPQKVEPTNTKDGSHLVIIKDSGLTTWGIKDEKIFPTRDDISGTAIGIAVLDKEHNLVGIALGRGDTGTNNPIGGFNGSVTIGNILHNDGSISKLSKESRIKIEIERSGSNTKIKLEDAEKLNKAVIMDVAREPNAKKIVAEIEGMPKLQVASVDSPSAPLAFAGKPSKSEQGLA